MVRDTSLPLLAMLPCTRRPLTLLLLLSGILYASQESHYSVFKAARMYRMPAVKVRTPLHLVACTRCMAAVCAGHWCRITAAWQHSMRAT
jgi:hypothetical protein